jgi:hypothetical protein
VTENGTEQPFDRLDAAEKSRSTLWLYGSSREITSSVIYIEYYGYNSLVNKTTELFRGTLRTDALEQTAALILSRLRPLVAGDSWASVIVTSGVEGFTLLLNGRRVAGAKALYWLTAGSYSIEANRSGYNAYQTTFALAPGEERLVELAFSKTAQAPVQIITAPEQARVFIDGEYKGVTPLSFEAGIGQQLTLQKAGYVSQNFTVGREGLALDITLIDTEGSLYQSFAKSRRRYHISLGVFIGSLVLPIVFYGLEQDARERAGFYGDSGDAAARQRELGKADGYRIAFWSSSGVSAVLLGFSFFSLYDYIKAADRMAGEERK